MLCLQSALRQQLELERDAAVHKQQLEVARHMHALQLAQQAHTAAQTESDRLRQKHVQEVELCEVWSQLPLRCHHYIATTICHAERSSLADAIPEHFLTYFATTTMLPLLCYHYVATTTLLPIMHTPLCSVLCCFVNGLQCSHKQALASA